MLHALDGATIQYLDNSKWCKAANTFAGNQIQAAKNPNSHCDVGSLEFIQQLTIFH